MISENSKGFWSCWFVCRLFLVISSPSVYLSLPPSLSLPLSSSLQFTGPPNCTLLQKTFKVAFSQFFLWYSSCLEVRVSACIRACANVRLCAWVCKRERGALAHLHECWAPPKHWKKKNKGSLEINRKFDERCGRNFWAKILIVSCLIECRTRIYLLNVLMGSR